MVWILIEASNESVQAHMKLGSICLSKILIKRYQRIFRRVIQLKSLRWLILTYTGWGNNNDAITSASALIVCEIRERDASPYIKRSPHIWHPWLTYSVGSSWVLVNIIQCISTELHIVSLYLYDYYKPLHKQLLKCNPLYIGTSNFMRNLLQVFTASADGLAPISVGPSAGTVVTADLDTGFGNYLFNVWRVY